jgi:hypothetical protein
MMRRLLALVLQREACHAEITAFRRIAVGFRPVQVNARTHGCRSGTLFVHVQQVFALTS